jgi:RNA polymerase sigma factor (sigma-70 family)|nr:MAG: DNA-directed RNA polymerase sigma-70 factor [Bacteroidota bacterium]
MSEQAPDKALQQADEALLLEAFRNGHREDAFSELVRRYQERIYRLIRRMVRDHETTDDLVQEVFVRVWESLDRFRGQAGLYSWIYRIAVNTTMSHFRRERLRRWIRLEEIFPGPTDPSSNPAEAVERQEREALLAQALKRLPPKQRLVFSLRYFEELSYEEIAALLDTSVGALKANYHHAVRKLAHYLPEEIRSQEL